MGNTREIIDEFPFFSFYLADLHPHVISIPFTILVLFWALTQLRSTVHLTFPGFLSPTRRSGSRDLFAAA
jgi:hypothetical protein